LEIGLSAWPLCGACIFAVEALQESEVGKGGAYFGELPTFSGAHSRQTKNAGANGEIRFALLMALVTARAQCGPVGNAPLLMGRHGDCFQYSGIIGSDTGH